MTKEEILRKAQCLEEISHLLGVHRRGLKKHPELCLPYTLWNLIPSKTSSEKDYHLIQASNKYWNLVHF